MFIIPEGYSAVHSGTKKNHVVNGPPRATNVNCIYSGYPAPHCTKLKDYVAARSPNIIKGVGAVKETEVTRNDVKRCPSSSRFYSKYQKF